MKKFFLFMAFSLSLTCCQDNLNVQDIDENNPSDRIIKKTKFGGDGNLDLLGYGYDITGEYLDPKSTRFNVIDINKLNESGENNIIIDDFLTNSKDNYFYYGINGLEYIKDINTKVISKNSGDNTFPLKVLGENLLGFTKTLNFDKDEANKKTILSKKLYAKSETAIKVKRLIINKTPSELYQFLSTDFKMHLNTYTPEQLISAYGTHVLTDITIGGRLWAEMISIDINIYSDSIKLKNLKTDLNASLQKIGLNTDNEVSISETETINRKNIIRNLHVGAIGGTKGIDISYDLIKDNPDKLETQEWINSVYDNKGKYAALAEVNWKKTYPIYEFIQDETKREAVKQAVIRYIEDWQINLLTVSPLIEWYNRSCNYHVYAPNTDWQFQGNEWKCKGPIGAYIFEKQVEGTVPLIQWYNTKYYYHSYTTNPNDNSFQGKDWKCDGNVGIYVYDTPQKGTIPLIQWRTSILLPNRKGKDVFFKTDPTWRPNLKYFPKSKSYSQNIAYVIPID